MVSPFPPAPVPGPRSFFPFALGGARKKTKNKKKKEISGRARGGWSGKNIAPPRRKSGSVAPQRGAAALWFPPPVPIPFFPAGGEEAAGVVHPCPKQAPQPRHPPPKIGVGWGAAPPFHLRCRRPPWCGLGPVGTSGPGPATNPKKKNKKNKIEASLRFRPPLNGWSVRADEKTLGGCWGVPPGSRVWPRKKPWVVGHARRPFPHAAETEKTPTAGARGRCSAPFFSLSPSFLGPGGGWRAEKKNKSGGLKIEGAGPQKLGAVGSPRGFAPYFPRRAPFRALPL